MEELDIFDLLGLSFDPLETSARTVSQLFRKKTEALQNEYNGTENLAKKHELKAQMDFLSQQKKDILSEDEKKLNLEKLKPLAEKKFRTSMQTLRTFVSVYRDTSHISSITDQMIKHFRRKFTLSEAHIRETFEEFGFTVVSYDTKKDLPVFPTQIGNFVQMLAQIRQQENNTVNSQKDPASAVDLYSFLAFFDADPGRNAAVYRAMDRQQLYAICDNLAKIYSQRNSDDMSKLCAAVLSNAQTHILATDDQLAAYQSYQNYQDPKLQELFSALKATPKSILRTADFAEPCIKKIMKRFPEYKTAVAIYNQEANLILDAYVPETWQYTVRCGYCDTVCSFRSEAEAQQTNRCQNCQKPLFKKCSKCGKIVNESKEICPHCKYVFSSAAMFTRYFRNAEEALRKSDFRAAREALFAAREAAPNETARISQLASEIQKQEQRYQEPLNRLKALTGQKKYAAAQQLVSTILMQYPGLNISEYEQQIRGVLARADRQYDAAAGLSPSKKADVCISILMECADHSRAAVFLRNTPPLPSSRFTLMPDAKQGEIQVSWARSEEKGIQYRLVRKPGKVPPISAEDGMVLLDDRTVCAYTDKDITPGQFYTYAVFVIRLGVCSDAVSRTGILLTDVQNLAADQIGSSIRLTWDAPGSGMRALVYRSSGGQQTLLTDRAFGSFEDPNVQFRTTYTYRICACYGGGQNSPGAEITVTPLPKIASFSVAEKQISATVYEVSWDIQQPGVDIRVLVNGQNAANAVSEQHSTQITLPSEQFSIVDVQAFSGGEWLSCTNPLRLNTYSPCRISRKASAVSESAVSTLHGTEYRTELKIVMDEPFPPNITAFYYAVRTGASGGGWVTLKDLHTAADVSKIAAGAYRQQGAILHQEIVPQMTVFYVSVFTVYKIGADEVISESDRVRIEPPMEANLFWSLKSGLFGLKLHIRMKGDRMIESVPELLLCACDARYHLTGPGDANAAVLARIPASKPELPVSEYQGSFSVKSNIAVKDLRQMKLFLFTQNVPASDIVTVRWDPPFEGHL